MRASQTPQLKRKTIWGSNNSVYLQKKQEQTVNRKELFTSVTHMKLLKLEQYKQAMPVGLWKLINQIKTFF